MPSITDGLFAGRAGIQSHGTAISVLADNIANQNTTGFKSSRADFVDLLAGSLGGGAGSSTGSGSSVINITRILSQGTFEFTGRGLDVGIDGNGYFVVQDANGGAGRFFTRAGNFQVDTEGNLLDQNGYQVLGFPSNGAGGLESLNVNERIAGSVETLNVNITGNLDASSDVQAWPGAGATFAQLNDAAAFSTFVDVFDSLGQAHSATIYFYHTNTTPGTWDVRGYVDGGDITAGVAGTPSPIFNTTLTFSATGTQVAPAPVVAAANWANGATPGAINFEFDPFTQFSSNSNIESISQDGTGSGSVTGFSIGDDGSLFAQLDNGQTSNIGRIALAIFSNGEGLQRVGNSLFAESTASGEPVIGTPNTGTFGRLESGALELSTADIAGDFIKLISLQRGFQGSSRIITNIDDLLNEILQLA